MIVNFSKMHGSGNDFVVIDLVTQAGALSPACVRDLAHRHTGVGFDQLLTIEPPTIRTADFFYRIYMLMAQSQANAETVRAVLRSLFLISSYRPSQNWYCKQTPGNSPPNAFLARLFE